MPTAAARVSYAKCAKRVEFKPVAAQRLYRSQGRMLESHRLVGILPEAPYLPCDMPRNRHHLWPLMGSMRPNVVADIRRIVTRARFGGLRVVYTAPRTLVTGRVQPMGDSSRHGRRFSFRPQIIAKFSNTGVMAQVLRHPKCPRTRDQGPCRSRHGAGFDGCSIRRLKTNARNVARLIGC
jgi:hypothetical protein